MLRSVIFARTPTRALLLQRSLASFTTWSPFGVVPCSSIRPTFLRVSSRDTLALFATGNHGMEFRVFRDTLRHIPEGKKLTAGNLIEFRKESELVLGVVEGQQANKWVVYDQKGEVCTVRGQDISLVLPGASYNRGDIAVFVENANGVDSRCIEVAWQTMGDTTQPITLEEMAQLLLNNDSPTGIYMAYTMLKDIKSYFRMVSRDPPLYFRMSPSEVQILQQGREKAEEKRNVQEAFKNDVAEVLGRPYADRSDASEWSNGKHSERILALKDFALVDGPSMLTRNLAMESLRVCGISLTPNGAVRLLESLRVFSKHEPVALLRAGIKDEFPDDVMAATDDITPEKVPDVDASSRRDFTHLRAFSIDDAGTREIDDAISVERLPDGRCKVWTHVSDPSRWITLDSVLDLEARKRVISLYVPTGAIPVYPWKLSEGCFSLRTGEAACALSFGAVLNEEGDIQSYEVVPSIVAPQTSLSYDETEDIIEKESDKDLATLVEISKLRNTWRRSKGAVDIALPECEIKATVKQDTVEDPEVRMIKRDKDSVSRTMVTELMILAGEIAGRIGSEHQLALPYRSQVSPVLPKADEMKKLPEGPCRAVALRNRMMRGNTSSTHAQPHASLGIAAYVQTTSPIRRYSDFLAHVQLKAHLRNEAPPLSSADLERLLTITSRTSTTRLKAVTEAINYWIAEFFKRQQHDTTWTVTVLSWIKQPSGITAVMFDDLGLERRMRIDRPAKPGDKLTVAVAGVDVMSGSVRFEESHSRHLTSTQPSSL